MIEVKGMTEEVTAIIGSQILHPEQTRGGLPDLVTRIVNRVETFM